MKKLIFLYIFLLSISTKAQDILLQRCDISASNSIILEALEQLSTQGINLSYSDYDQLYTPIDLIIHDMELDFVLERLFENTNLDFVVIGKNVVVFKKKKLYTISGYITDCKSGEKLIGSSIFNYETLSGTVSNNYGFYSISLPPERNKLNYSYVGYEPFEFETKLYGDSIINVCLANPNQMSVVEIQKTQFIPKLESSQISLFNFPIKSFKNVPLLLGESDIKKSIELIPGFKSGGDASGGLYVRGGSPDQNLFLLDGVPVYNSDHLFGFFSIFNIDAVQSVKIYSGAFPSRYGGRLSSVVDIRLKDGNVKDFEAKIDVGIISTKCELEIPIKKDQTALVFSFRRTYLDMFLAPLLDLVSKVTDYEDLNVSYSFYDFYTKFSHKFPGKSSIYFSSYIGNDAAYYQSENETDTTYSKDYFSLGWGNQTISLRWNYIPNSKMFCNTTFIYSRYYYENLNNFTRRENNDYLSEYEYEYISGINDIGVKVDLDYMPKPDHYIKFGASATRHTFTPGIKVTEEFKSDRPEFFFNNTFGNEKLQSTQLSAYFEDDMDLNRYNKINIGIRYTGFITHNKLYNAVEPRFSYRMMLSKQLALKCGIAKMSQFMHLLSNTTIGFPTDIWLPITDSIKPQQSLQFTLGTVLNLPDNVTLSLEGYYKYLTNLIEYKEGYNFKNNNDSWDQLVETGEGKAYGVEFMLHKPHGQATGWIGYTLSWANRQFPNINNGEIFPYRYDRRHDISFVFMYQLSKHFHLSVNWKFGTGYGFTLPSQKFLVASPNGESEEYLWHYSKRNNFKMPNYHRLDFAIKMKKELPHGKRIWTIGVYNAYNHKNPFVYYVSPQKDSGNILKEISLLPLIPTISYSFKFEGFKNN